MPGRRLPGRRVIKIPWDEWNRITRPGEPRVSDEIERRWLREYLREHPERDLRSRPRPAE